MRCLRPLIVAVFALIGSAHVVRPVEAAESRGRERLAIGRLSWSGNIPQPLRKTLAERLVDGLRVASFEVLRQGADSALSSPAAACTDADCWRGVAGSLGVSYLVAAAVEERDKTFAITLELLSGRSGGVVGTTRERCEICGAEEVGEKMALATATLRARLEALAQAPSRFVIRTRPDGASVRLDGKPAGRTPLDVNLVSGQHEVVIERDGFSPLERSFVATSGVDETLDLDLVRLPTTFPFRAAGWAAIGAGVALAAGGIYVLSMDGNEVKCSGSDKDPLGHCPKVYQTNLLGASLLGLSAVSATLGGVWLYLDRPASGALLSNERAQLGSVLVGTSGRF
jgi:hypothetical protein